MVRSAVYSCALVSMLSTQYGTYFGKFEPDCACVVVCHPYLLAIKTARVYHITRLSIPNVAFLNNLKELNNKKMNLWLES